MLKITIITPSYNQGQFLEQTICSVLEQGYPNLEYFVIDGGSTDNSVDIIRRYEKYLAGWISEPDAGQTHAINKGLARATGDIMAYLNSDDIYSPTALHTVAHYMDQSPRIRWLVGACGQIDVSGNALTPFKHSMPQSLTQYLMRTSGFLPQPSSFWDARLFKQYGMFDSSMHFSFDYEYHCRLLWGGEVPILIDDQLAAFRVHPKSKGVAQCDYFLAERLKVARQYARTLTLKDRIKLYRNMDYRARLTAIVQSNEGDLPLWVQVCKRPWWIASHDIRYALSETFINRRKEAA